MIRLTLAQMRQSVGRLVAAGIAIVIGTAFVAVTILAGDVLRTSTNASLAAVYGDADLVVTANPRADTGTLTVSDIDALRAVPGVTVDPVAGIYAELTHGRSQITQYATGAGTDPRTNAQDVTQGGMPSADDEVALPADVAKRLDVRIGDTIGVEAQSTDWGQDASQPDPLQAKVVGILDDPYGAYSSYGGAAVLARGLFDRWDAAMTEPDGSYASDATVVLGPGTSADAARAALTKATPGAEVRTPDQVAQAKSAAWTGGQNVILGAVFAFAAIALVVAALVIANTFQVLVAHRARTLALLRAVGARKRQLARSVLLEGAILGVAASLLGVGAGYGIGAIALRLARNTDIGPTLPATVPASLAAVVVPLALGVIITVLACLVPARATGRVSPLEALRPAETRDVRTAGKVRLAFFIGSVVLGLAVLGAGVFAGTQDESLIAIVVSVLGASISFVGLVLGGTFWMPPLVGLVGRLAARVGPGGRLAAANTARNPRRTAATSAALFIGVTLVATMATGAVSASATATQTLDDHYPVDVMISGRISQEGDIDPLPAAFVDTVRGTDGVEHVAEARSAAMAIRAAGRAEDMGSWDVTGVDPATWDQVLRTNDHTLTDLKNGEIVLSPSDLEVLGVPDGGQVEVGPAGSSITLTARESNNLGRISALVTADDLARLAPSAPVTSAFVRVKDSSAVDTVLAIQDEAASAGGSLLVLGPAAERAQAEHQVQIILGVVVGLLAVAVIIAFIGVTNTLSLSVIERRRESATLRAVGLTRRQLRRTLALEGVLIAGIGAVAGIVVGTIYGWAGSLAAFSVMGHVTLAVPWTNFALLLLVALAAGWLASVLPARAATRTSPVASLAVD